MNVILADDGRYARACAAYQRIMACSQNTQAAIHAYDAELASAS